MTKPIKPFLKWPGGKRWLVPFIQQHLPGRTFARYFEPFLGGGAVFFGLQPPRATLSDVNPELINTYLQVQANSAKLLTRLQLLPIDKDTYLAMRAARPDDPIDQAVRFLYLNRTAFGGMYRLNRRGEFNVPYGGGQRTPQPLWTDSLLADAAGALSDVTLIASDFEATMKQAGDGDLVYCDPTYTVAHNNNGFIRYNESNFSWKDQQRLASACRDAASRGAHVLVSNAVHPDILDLYPNATHLELRRKSLICPAPEKRRTTSEYLLVLSEK